jgi:hypothetical protein
MQPVAESLAGGAYGGDCLKVGTLLGMDFLVDGVTDQMVYFPPLETKPRIEHEVKGWIEVTEIALVGLNIFISFFSIVWLWFQSSMKKNKVILNSTPVMLMAMCVGSILVSLALYINSYKTTTADCYTAIVLISLGITSLFGSITIKNYRISRLMNNKRLKKIKITNRDLFMGYLAMLSTDLVILFFIYMYQPLKLHNNDLDIFFDDHIETTNECMTVDNQEPFLVNLLFLEKLVLLLNGAHVSWKIRKAPSYLNESAWVARSLYFALVIGALCFPLSLLLKDPGILRILLHVSFFWITLSTLMFMLIPKYWYVKYGVPELMEKRHATSTYHTTAGTSRSQGTSDSEKTSDADKSSAI